MFEQMIYGMEFYRQPGPDLPELEKDMKLLKAKGFNLLRIQEVWSYEEPEEGVYDFDKIRGIVELAEETGIDLIVTFSLECAPPWLYQLNDVFQRNGYGEPIIETTPYPLPADGKPGPCWDNPIAIRAAEKFVKAFIEEIGKSDAIKGWAVWQEAGIWPWNDSRGRGGSAYCYCPHTLARFREWLKAKYGSIKAMNRKLFTNFSDWCYVSPPNGYKDAFMVPLASEFFHFMIDRMGSIAKWKKEIVNRCDPEKRPVMCHVNGGVLVGGISNKWDDEYTLAGPMDLFGMSLYPKWGSGRAPNAAAQYIMLACDTSRCAAQGKDIWAAEIQCGRQASGLRRSSPPTGNEIRNWTFLALGRGLKGFVFWQYREEIMLQEAYGHGILNRRGESTPWLDPMSEMIGFLKLNEAFFRKGQLPKARIAIAINLDVHVLGYQCNTEDFFRTSARNIYNNLIDRNIYPDFVWNTAALGGGLSRYDLVFLPAALAMSAEYALAIRRYVESGGVVVSDGGIALYDELSNATSKSPGFGLDEVFGCVENAYYDVEDPYIKGKVVTERNLVGTGAFFGLSIEPALMVQTFAVATGKEILSFDGCAAGVVNSFGSGRAYLAGTVFSETEANEGFIDKILELEGIPVTGRKNVMEQRLQSRHGVALLLYNKEDREATQPVDLPENQLVEDFYGCELEYASGKPIVKLGCYSSGCLILKNK